MIPETMFEDKDKKMGIKTAEDDLFSDVARIIPFNVPTLDIVLGGGLYTGKIYEVMGWESSGKSTLALEATKAFSKYWISQKDNNYLILWIETESAVDKARALFMGCDLTNFLFREAETVEVGFEIMDYYLKKCQLNGFHLLIIWDTIAAAPTNAEIAEPTKKKSKDEDGEEKETSGQYQGGLAEKARIIRYNLRKLTQPLAQTDSIMFIVNQLYHVPQKSRFKGAETERSPGGEGFHFHASARLKTTKKEDLTKVAPDGQTYSEGILTEVFTNKNKLTLPKQRAILVMKGETGIDKFETLVRYLRTAKLIDMSGSWATFNFPTVIKHEEKIGIEVKEIKFQNAKQLQEVANETPGLEDYMDYLVYRSYSYISPLIKVKIIRKLWGYEERFLGKRETLLTDREKEVAIMLDKMNQEDFGPQIEEEKAKKRRKGNET